jgi:hypothetical protein
MPINITPEMFIEIKTMAKLRGVTASQVVRDIIADRFELKNQLPPRHYFTAEEIRSNAQISNV